MNLSGSWIGSIDAAVLIVRIMIRKGLTNRPTWDESQWIVAHRPLSKLTIPGLILFVSQGFPAFPLVLLLSLALSDVRRADVLKLI